jgi:predicted RNA-binding Zn ribbon-like protein
MVLAYTETTSIGPIAIAFVNTSAAGRHTSDQIADHNALATWLTQAGLLDNQRFPRSPPLRREITVEAHRLRTEIRALFNSLAQGTAPSPVVLGSLNRLLEAGAWSRRLTLQDGTVQVETIQVNDEARSLLAPVALAAAEIAAHALPHRLRTCASAECGRWFLDTSKGGRRRWCSMTTCGNRSKAARFRERHGDDGDADQERSRPGHG